VPVTSHKFEAALEMYLQIYELTLTHWCLRFKQGSFGKDFRGWFIVIGFWREG
jgi:hypothetical protein